MEKQSGAIQFNTNVPGLLLRPNAGETGQQLEELEVLRNAIDSVEQGIVLINDGQLVQFVNKKARGIWGLSSEQCRGRLSVVDYIGHVRSAGLYDVPNDEIEAYVAKRVSLIKVGDPTPIDIPVSDGRTIRAQCTALTGGGRMLTYTDVTDLVQRAKQQEVLATTDVLTGIHNRRHFVRLAEAAWTRSRRHEHDLSLLYIDIDNFKAINDALGHDAGDQAIIRVAQVCQALKSSTDIAGRMGGDEFVVLMPGSGILAALSFAERLRSAVGRERFSFDGMRAHLTLSIGIAQAAVGLNCVTELLRVADARLLQAKRAGRNCTAWGEAYCYPPLRRHGFPCRGVEIRRRSSRD